MAAGLLGDAQGGLAGTAGEIENLARFGEAQPGDKEILLLGGQPAGLADILAKGLTPDVGIEIGREIAIARTIKIDALVGCGRLHCLVLAFIAHAHSFARVIPPVRELQGSTLRRLSKSLSASEFSLIALAVWGESSCSSWRPL